MSKPAFRCLVLSVRPHFAEAIADGTKTIDVRRIRPNVQPGTLGLIYSSSPAQAVVGSFRIDEVLSGTPDEIWRVAEGEALLSKGDFDKYFAGVEFSHAIVVSCGKRLPTPIQLSDLRTIWPGLKPPRSFGYLVATDARSQRLMSAFKDSLLNEGSLPEEPPIDHGSSYGSQDRQGSFQLGVDQMRTLVSLLKADGEQSANGQL